MKKNIHLHQTSKTKTKRRNIHSRRRRPRPRQKGGSGTPVKEGPGPFSVLRTALSFGISSILIGPLYLLAEILNVPISNINNLSWNAFKENKQAFLHLPFHKVLTGCGDVKEMEDDKFILPEGMNIHQHVSVVSCDKETEGKENIKVHPPSIQDSIMNFMGMIPAKRQFKYNVFRLFHYIDNLRETDDQRKIKIQKLIREIVSYKTLIKCYLISRTIGCSAQSKQTILSEEDVVHIVTPWANVPAFDTKVRCLWKHLSKKNFDADDKKLCNAPCHSCTFNNSVRRMTRKYFSFFSGGSSAMTPMLNTYYEYLKINRGNHPLPTKETELVPYLNKITVTSDLNDKLEEEDKTEVLKMFNRFLCKYEIIQTVKEQIELKVKKELEKGYTMEQILSFV